MNIILIMTFQRAQNKFLLFKTSYEITWKHKKCGSTAGGSIRPTEVLKKRILKRAEQLLQ